MTFARMMLTHVNVKIHSAALYRPLVVKIAFHVPPFVIRFSHQGKTIAELAKATCKLLQSAYPDIYTPRFITGFSKNKNLKDMLVSTKLQ